MEEIDRLLEIMARLRAPEGCPWDREQTPATLRAYLIEEAYEAAEALDDGSWPKLCEELGDLLLQVVFLSRLAEEAGAFRFADVAAAINAKLVRRHPHVFSDGAARTVGEVWRRWELIKRAERDEMHAGRGPSRLDGTPRALPALAKARLYADKAARVGFDWPSPGAIVQKIREETAELTVAIEAGEPGPAGAELGDLIFAAASLARRLGLDPETCLAQANRKFSDRFRKVEESAAAQGRRLEDFSAAELNELWESAKRR